MIDAVIILAMGLGIHLKQSRACAIILGVYAVISVIVTLVSTGKFSGYLLIAAGAYAISSTFQLKKRWEEYQANSPYPNP